ncbi:Thioredoxin [Lasiodiplodia theobromae]|uniref:Thioredoxin n=1 Tax=Lasiodiplodia theobromae TaxID=45133 RepID=A0A5N5D6Y3_9PEZI|nr:Thioredoxin [Lasiodiplodia theobromae]KAB2573104.1 Thioredoxin [Lasiodiplodia theobromae]KAF4533851.1 Thioredoxin [Lasiodiplodia theobromae]KAF9638143.1 Thioredoxin [Lasiodiplodia theobromae]
MSKITHISGMPQWNSILSSNTYVVADFYADWCGPCKAIAPVFEQLAQQEAKPGRLSFVKVDVDAQQGVAGKYGVSAMPTFLVFKNGSVTETIRGANPAALRAAVTKAAADAAKGPGRASTAFQSKGHVLGNAGGASSSSSATTGDWAWNLTQRRGGLLDTVVRFVALYVITLFSFDAFAAARESPFNVNKKNQ